NAWTSTPRATSSACSDAARGGHRASPGRRARRVPLNRRVAPPFDAATMPGPSRAASPTGAVLLVLAAPPFAAGARAHRVLLDELPHDAEAWSPRADAGPRAVALDLPADADVRGLA